MTDLTIVIPAYNEADALPSVMSDVVTFCDQHNFAVVVVNDGSSDNTGEVLEEFSDHPLVTIATHKVNRGYGGAIKTGIRTSDSRFVITIDADGQHDLEDVAKLCEEMNRTGADMIVGSRTAHKDASLYRSIGKRLIRTFARILLPIHIEDINSGIKIYDRELALRYIKLCPDHMAFSDIITMVFISERRLVLEKPVNILPRVAGVSTISTLTAIETVREILNIVVLFNPMRVFFPIAAASMIMSLAWGVPIVLQGRGVSVGALLGFSTGLLFFFLGLIAEQLSQMRKRSVHDT